MLLGGFKEMINQQSYDEVGSGSSQEQTFRVSEVIEVTHLPTLPSLLLGSKREREREMQRTSSYWASLHCGSTVAHFYKLKARPSSSKRITTYFVVRCALW